MPAIIEQLPTSDDEDQDQVFPPTEGHPVAKQAESSRTQASPAAGTLDDQPATAGAFVEDDADNTDDVNEQPQQPEQAEERTVDVELCTRLKEAGNQLFKEGSISEALAMYRKALWSAPIKPPPKHQPANRHMPKPSQESVSPSDSPVDASHGEQAAGEGGSDRDDEEDDAVVVDTTDYTVTSQLYCNAGFCLMKLDVKEEAAQMLSEAIRHDERYLKAYIRRADCYYDLQKWSNAYGDYESYEKLGGVLDPQGRARKAAAKTKVDEEMQKMLGELKNIGNKILGTFGLSTDNFKFDKDPNTGGYSMRFEQ